MLTAQATWWATCATALANCSLTLPWGATPPDAINISIYSFDGSDADVLTVRENLRQLGEAGVDVFIIAGKVQNGQARQNQLVPFGAPGIIPTDATGEQIPGALMTGNANLTSQGSGDALGTYAAQQMANEAQQATAVPETTTPTATTTPAPPPPLQQQGANTWQELIQTVVRNWITTLFSGLFPR